MRALRSGVPIQFHECFSVGTSLAFKVGMRTTKRVGWRSRGARRRWAASKWTILLGLAAMIPSVAYAGNRSTQTTFAPSTGVGFALSPRWSGVVQAQMRVAAGPVASDAQRTGGGGSLTAVWSLSSPLAFEFGYDFIAGYFPLEGVESHEHRPNIAFRLQTANVEGRRFFAVNRLRLDARWVKRQDNDELELRWRPREELRLGLRIFSWLNLAVRGEALADLERRDSSLLQVRSGALAYGHLGRSGSSMQAPSRIRFQWLIADTWAWRPLARSPVGEGIDATVEVLGGRPSAEDARRIDHLVTFALSALF